MFFEWLYILEGSVSCTIFYISIVLSCLLQNQLILTSFPIMQNVDYVPFILSRTLQLHRRVSLHRSGHLVTASVLGQTTSSIKNEFVNLSQIVKFYTSLFQRFGGTYYIHLQGIKTWIFVTMVPSSYSHYVRSCTQMSLNVLKEKLSKSDNFIIQIKFFLYVTFSLCE